MFSSLLVGGLSDYHITLFLWGALILVSLIVELATDELTIIWGTVGAIFSFLAALLHADVWLQLLIFVVFTTLAFLIKDNGFDLTGTNIDSEITHAQISVIS